MSTGPDADLTRETACTLRDLIASGEVGPVEVLDAHLDAIERRNPGLNAIVTLATEAAREAAQSAEAVVQAGKPLGPLHGLPVVIKDVTPTAGIRTTYGCTVYADHIPGEDATVVAQLRTAGAIILGKSNTPEFAAGANTDNEVFGATRNPWNTDRSPAGSSGGSAAAVSSGMVPLAHGTDFGGSLRVPAAFCGIVGLRTTPGLVPNHPMPLPFDPGQVHGPLARTAEDAALMLDGMAGFSPMSPISVAPPWQSCLTELRARENPAGLRIAYAPEIAGIGIDPEVAAVCEAAVDELRRTGATVDEISLDLSVGREAFKVLRGEWMVGQQLERLEHIEQFGANLAGNIRQGLELDVRATAAAEQIRAQVWHSVRDCLTRHDVILTPTAPVLPFQVGQNYPEKIGGVRLENYIDWVAQAFLITLTGFPAASAPAGLSDSRLPVGLQIIGPRLGEPTILAVAKLLQQVRPVGWPPAAI
ncbi:MAG: amidase [Rhodospirillaceae bacterium]|jgi:amidase|nr:amidase [Rhodospirillaceae bacterium]